MCRGRSKETYTPAINTLPQETGSPQLIGMEGRVANLVSTLRTAGGQLQALYLIGPPGIGTRPVLIPITIGDSVLGITLI